jgi:hypothetical protein
MVRYLSKQRKLYVLSLTHRLNSCNNNFGFASAFLPNPRSQPQPVKVEGFAPLSDSVVLVCAVLASLASGVLVAYGLCVAMFAAFRIHAAQVTTQSKTRVTEPAQIVEG